MGKGMFLVAATLLAAGGPWEVDASPSLYAGLTTPFTATDGCGDCWWCARDNASGHLYFDEAVFAPFSGTTTHSCMYGWSCLSHHGGCPGGGAATAGEVPQQAMDDATSQYLATLIHGVVAGEAGAAASLLAEFGDRITWHAERQAVQVTGCSAEVVLAHLPRALFPAETIAGLED